MAPSTPHRIVVVGGGFGGLQTIRALRGAPAEVTVVDRRNFHPFQPLLYQVATGALSPGEIASPLRGMFKRQATRRSSSARAWRAPRPGRSATSTRATSPRSAG